jgi:hypothetical protein
MSNEKAVIEISQSEDLAVRFSDKAVEAMKVQREQLKMFIKGQMVEGVDFGTIPGTPKPSLYKPGAEKLANIFQLGSRIVGEPEKIIDQEGPGFAMFTYTVEIFHIPTGKAIAQCQGSANSQEKKYKRVALGDLFNTLQKMAQKRAYVGAIVSACGASDFFTQDLEDMRGTGIVPESPEDQDIGNYILKYGRAKGYAMKEARPDQLRGFIEWFNDAKITAPAVKAEKELVEAYLRCVVNQ